MPESIQRLGKLSKSIGSFCITCGLGAKKKTPEKGEFWVSKPQIVGPATAMPSVHGKCLKAFYTFLRF